MEAAVVMVMTVTNKEKKTVKHSALDLKNIHPYIVLLDYVYKRI